MTGSSRIVVSPKTAEIAGDLWDVHGGMLASHDTGNRSGGIAERDRTYSTTTVNPKVHRMPLQCEAFLEYRHVFKTRHVPRGTSNASAFIHHVMLLMANLELEIFMGILLSLSPSLSVSLSFFAFLISCKTLIYRRCFATLDRHPMPTSLDTSEGSYNTLSFLKVTS